jgi:hypothetical protein
MSTNCLAGGSCCASFSTLLSVTPLAISSSPKVLIKYMSTPLSSQEKIRLFHTARICQNTAPIATEIFPENRLLFAGIFLLYSIHCNKAFKSILARR